MSISKNLLELKVKDKVYCKTKKNIEKDAKQMLPDADYKAATTRKRIRQKVPNDGDTPEVYLNARLTDVLRTIGYKDLIKD